MIRSYRRSKRTADVLISLDTKIAEVTNIEGVVKAQQDQYEHHRQELIADIQKSAGQNKQSSFGGSVTRSQKESQDDAMDWETTPSLGKKKWVVMKFNCIPPPYYIAYPSLCAL